MSNKSNQFMQGMSVALNGDGRLEAFWIGVEPAHKPVVYHTWQIATDEPYKWADPVPLTGANGLNSGLVDQVSAVADENGLIQVVTYTNKGSKFQRIGQIFKETPWGDWTEIDTKG